MDSSNRFGAIIAGLAVGFLLAIFALAWTSDNLTRACAQEIATLGSYNPDEIRRICK